MQHQQKATSCGMFKKCDPKELEKTLLLLDPFEISIHKDNCVSGQQVEETLESEIRSRISSSKQQLKGSRLAEMLSENDPLEVVNAMKNMGNIYQSSTTHIQENENVTCGSSLCINGETCSGCPFCDGMECYMEVDKNNDSFIAAGDEEDDLIFPEVGGGEVFDVDSDDENIKISRTRNLKELCEGFSLVISRFETISILKESKTGGVNN
mmetsp:Transcript_25896/g.37148  ORF Transcript_25896/g.37148 Transcript_25896/m.37148 type:complete len:210 (+) Transcript_25896:58-687(+)